MFRITLSPQDAITLKHIVEHIQYHSSQYGDLVKDNNKYPITEIYQVCQKVGRQIHEQETDLRMKKDRALWGSW